MADRRGCVVNNFRADMLDKMKKPIPTEKEVTKSIRQFLDALGIWHFKHWSGQYTSIRGISDILGIYKGKFLAIEVKRPGGKLSYDQSLFLDVVERNGGIAFKAESTDDVMNGLCLDDRFKPHRQMELKTERM